MKNKRTPKVSNFNNAIASPKHEAKAIGLMAFSAISPCVKAKGQKVIQVTRHI
jgi:hypothetical protein